MSLDKNVINKKPKIIIFDIGGVLLSWRDVIPKVAKLLNISDQTFIQELHSHNFDIDLGKIHQDIFWKYLSEKYKTEVTQEDLKKTWIEEQPPIRAGWELLKDIKNAGYRVACCTNNWKGTVKRQMEIYPDFSLFEFVLNSADVGTRKPDEKIYKIIEDGLQLKGSDIFFIDDMEENCETAKRMGWQTYIFDNTESEGYRDSNEIKKILGI